MPQWATFAGFAIVVTAGLLLLSHASRGVIDTVDSDADSQFPTEETIVLPKSGVELRVGEVREDSRAGGTDSTATISPSPDASAALGQRSDVDDSPGESQSTAATEWPAGPSTAADDESESTVGEVGATVSPATPKLTTASLLANVALSQGLFGALLLAGAWYAEIPASAFGIGGDAIGLGAVAVGVVIGVVLYVANEAGATVGAQFGLGDGERLRSLLAPDSALGWAALLFVVLPIIAGFEELLFRGALIGVLAAGYEVSPWLLAVLSSAAFGLGHGAQGRIGVLVTGALGFALAAAFILTGSLFVVALAHYLVNALEFIVHEGLGIEWADDA